MSTFAIFHQIPSYPLLFYSLHHIYANLPIFLIRSEISYNNKERLKFLILFLGGQSFGHV